MNVTFSNKWRQVASLLGLACENQDTVKEMYREYIGMVKLYYEDAKRMQGKPDVEVNDGSDHAEIIGPQVDAEVVQKYKICKMKLQERGAGL